VSRLQVGGNPAPRFGRITRWEDANFTGDEEPENADGVADPFGVGYNRYPVPSQ
jgi:hypothetical protein